MAQEIVFKENRNNLKNEDKNTANFLKNFFFLEIKKRKPKKNPRKFFENFGKKFLNIRKVLENTKYF